MASILKQLKALPKTPVYRVVEMLVYAAMFLLVLIYFTGNGEFIYEL